MFINDANNYDLHLQKIIFITLIIIISLYHIEFKSFLKNYYIDEYKDVTENVIISDLEEIIENAFSQWPLLSTAKIGNSVIRILSYAFQSCSKLEKVEFGQNLESLSYNSFNNCGFVNITIPGSIKTIGQSAFCGCNKLKTVIIEEGLITLGDYTFQQSANLRNVNIPSSVTTIRSNPFAGCPNLLFINVSKENSYYANFDNDGTLYDKDFTKLISHPSGDLSITFTIPLPITSIEIHGFEMCSAVETVFIGKMLIQSMHVHFIGALPLNVFIFMEKSNHRC